MADICTAAAHYVENASTPNPADLGVKSKN